jgi:dUTPase
VLLFNYSENPYIVCSGDKIGKLICEKIYYPELYLLKKLDGTWRGKTGFGSNGQN